MLAIITWHNFYFDGILSLVSSIEISDRNTNMNISSRNAQSPTLYEDASDRKHPSVRLTHFRYFKKTPNLYGGFFLSVLFIIIVFVSFYYESY